MLKMILVIFLISMMIFLLIPLVDDNTRDTYLPQWLAQYYYYFFLLMLFLGSFAMIQILNL